MALTWSEINTQLSLFLGDEGASSHSVPLRVAAWNWAQRILAQHTAREREQEIVVEANQLNAALPADLLQLASLYDPGRTKFWAPAHFQNGGYRGVASEMPLYWTWGNILRLEKPVSQDRALILFYYAYWPDIEAETIEGQLVIRQAQVLVPDWSVLPLLHLTAGNVLQPMALQSARNREYNIMIDSGKPTDNTRAQQAREHYWWWNELMGKFPVQARLGGVTE